MKAQLLVVFAMTGPQPKAGQGEEIQTLTWYIYGPEQCSFNPEPGTITGGTLLEQLLTTV